MISVIDSASLISGLVLGYAHASFVESWCHDRIQHARKPKLEQYKRYPLLGKHLMNAWKSHAVVHHGMSFRDSHVSQFQSPEHHVRARIYFREHKLNLANDFGLTVSWGGLLRFTLPFLVLTTLVAIVAPTHFSLPFGLMSLMSPVLSKYVHPQLHKPYDQAVANAPVLVRLLLRSPLGPSIWIRHFVHHRRPGGSFNLMLPIGDWLRGVHLAANSSDLAELRKAGGPPVDRPLAPR